MYPLPDDDHLALNALDEERAALEELIRQARLTITHSRRLLRRSIEQRKAIAARRGLIGPAQSPDDRVL
jgi:hypothetical protein